MKKLFSMLLALVMGLTCVSAVAETAAPASPSDPYTYEIDFEFNEDQLFSLMEVEATEENKALMDMIMPLLNNLGLRGVSTENGEEFFLTLNGAPIISLGTYADADSMTMISDLFPNYALEMPIDQMPIEMTEEEIMAVFTPHLLAASQAIQGYITGTETGAYEFEGVTFDTKTTVEMSAQQCITFFADTFGALLADEAVINLLNSLGEVTGLDEALAQLDAMKAEATEDTEGGMILNWYAKEGSEDMYVTGELRDGDVAFFLKVSSISDKIALQILMGDDVFLNQEQMLNAAMLLSPDAMLLNCTIIPGETEDDMDLQLDLYAEIYMGMHLKTAQLPLMGYALNMDFTFTPGADPLMSLTGVILNSGELSLHNTLTPAETITIDPAVVDESSEEYQLAMYNLSNDIASYGLNNLIANAAMAMPMEVSTLISYLMTPPETTESYTFDGVTD